jgi:isocitrate dehydrogenase
MKMPPLKAYKDEKTERVGVDISLTFDGLPQTLADKILPCVGEDGMELQMISNRGVVVWPHGQPDTFCADNWRLRFMSKNGSNVRTSQIIALMDRLNKADMNFTKAQMLYTFDGKPGFTAAQGQ